MILVAAAFAEPVVDATRVVTLSSPEVIGMGGAGLGFASGAVGTFFQPAAPANRRLESAASPLVVSVLYNRLSIPKGIPADVGNTGNDTWSGSMDNLGGALAFHQFGLGVGFSRLAFDDGDSSESVSQGHVVLGASGWDGHLAVGAGGRLVSFGATQGDDAARYLGAGGEVGIAVNRLGGWNVATVVRSGVRADREKGSVDLGVDGVAVPWQVAVGAGWQDAMTPRPRPVRVAADVVIDGPVDDGVSLEELPDLVTRGDRVSVTPHLGVELTALPNRLHVRAGSYLEPGRGVGELRPHATTGFELRLFHLQAFGLAADLSWEAAVDVAPRYLNVGWLGIGLWQRGVVGAGWRPRGE